MLLKPAEKSALVCSIREISFFLGRPSRAGGSFNLLDTCFRWYNSIIPKLTQD